MIEEHVKSKEGWDEIPLFAGTLNLLRQDGVSVQASVREAGPIIFAMRRMHSDKAKVIHVSIGPLRGCREDLSDEEHNAFILEETPKILTQLFGEDHTFQRMPADSRKPDVNHYYSEPLDA